MNNSIQHFRNVFKVNTQNTKKLESFARIHHIYIILSPLILNRYFFAVQGGCNHMLKSEYVQN